MVGVRKFEESELLAKALDLFWRQGLAGTSMPELAEATGVQRGSLYNAYKDKETLFLRAFDLYAAQFLDHARQALAADDAETALTRFFAAAIAHMTAGRPARGCLTSKTAADGSVVSERVRARLRGLVDALIDLIAQILSEKKMRCGLVLDPRESAQTIVAFTRGLAVMERIYADQSLLESLAHNLVRALVRSDP